MSEIGDIASKILNNREEKLKLIEERKKQKDEDHKKRLEHYVKQILNVFEASNQEENSDLLVWKVQVEYLRCQKFKCSVSFSTTDEEIWEDITTMEKSKHPLVIGAMKVVQACEPTPEILKDMYEFGKQIMLYDFELLEENKLKVSIYYNPLI